MVRFPGENRMKFDSLKFITGFVGGTFLIFLSVSQSLLWGSIVMGFLMGLLHEGYYKNAKSGRHD